MLEHSVEEHLVAEVKAIGGFSIKSDKIPGFRGLMDRICFLPAATLLLVELKRPKSKGCRAGKVSPHQALIHRILKDLGFVVHVAYTKAQVDALLGRFTSFHK